MWGLGKMNMYGPYVDTYKAVGKLCVLSNFIIAENKYI